MKRRVFLQTVGAIAAGTAASKAVSAPKDDSAALSAPAREVKMETQAEELSTHCGRYCGKCGICRYTAATSTAAAQNLVEAARFKRDAELIGWPLMRDMAVHCCAEFEHQVQSFAKLNPKFFPSSCRGGCVPDCEIAKCCKGKGYVTCADCPNMSSCSKITNMAKKYPEINTGLAEIKKKGLKQWAQEQFEAAKAERKKKFTDAIDKAFG